MSKIYYRRVRLNAILLKALITLQPMSISARLRSVLATLPERCRLIAVTKTHGSEKILEAYEAGHRAFGENKVQELVAKSEQLPRDIEWHLIGHLQTNKVKYIAPFVSLIHSVDSLKVLAEINKQALKSGRIIHCLLQVHIAEEESKFGFSEDEIYQLMSSPAFKGFSNILVRGLMGMATLTENNDQIRKEFRGLKLLFDKLRASSLPANAEMAELSMGMSSDYQIAVEEGSTMVRIGSSIFGQRENN